MDKINIISVWVSGRHSRTVEGDTWEDVEKLLGNNQSPVVVTVRWESGLSHLIGGDMPVGSKVMSFFRLRLAHNLCHAYSIEEREKITKIFSTCEI